MLLCRLPRLTTPQRQSHEAFRKRQEDRAFGRNRKDTGPPPLGSDPVEGDPVDVKALFEQGEREIDDEDELGEDFIFADPDPGENAVDKLLGYD